MVAMISAYELLSEHLRDLKPCVSAQGVIGRLSDEPHTYLVQDQKGVVSLNTRNCIIKERKTNLERLVDFPTQIGCALFVPQKPQMSLVGTTLMAEYNEALIQGALQEGFDAIAHNLSQTQDISAIQSLLRATHYQGVFFAEQSRPSVVVTTEYCEKHNNQLHPAIKELDSTLRTRQMYHFHLIMHQCK